ncbi:MAG: TrmH family RNA methyltransferase [Vicinamibacterales bacterium]
MVRRADPVGAPPGVIPIAAPDDPRVAEYRLIADPAALLRAGLFVVEGRLVLRRILLLPRFHIRSVLVTQTAFDALADALVQLDSRVPSYVVEPSVMNDLAGFQIHRGCLALAERPRVPLIDEMNFEAARRLLVLEGVNNPDNVGGIFRSAAAFGVDAVILGPGCGDPLYRKAIRTSMSGTLQVPFASAGQWPDALTALRQRGFHVLALTPASDAGALEDVPRNLERVALLVGTEGHGLSAGALAAVQEKIRIRMPGAADSLNVTVAASIALHHFGARE